MTIWMTLMILDDDLDSFCSLLSLLFNRQPLRDNDLAAAFTAQLGVLSITLAPEPCYIEIHLKHH
jgi:hypothetical protein